MFFFSYIQTKYDISNIVFLVLKCKQWNIEVVKERELTVYKLYFPIKKKDIAGKVTIFNNISLPNSIYNVLKYNCICFRFVI